MVEIAPRRVPRSHIARLLVWLTLAFACACQAGLGAPAPAVPTPAPAAATPTSTPTASPATPSAPASAATSSPAATRTPPATDAVTSGGVLTLDAALQMAFEGNRPLQNARFDVLKETKNAKAFRANQLPILEVQATASELVTPVSVSFDQGAFGTYQGVGPIPATNTQITTTPKLTTYFVLAIRQPITELPKIGLAAKMKEINVAVAAEDVRAQRDGLVTDVKRAYYAILQTQASLEAATDNLRFYQELNRTITEKYAEKTVLRADVLDVKRRLADAEFEVQQHRDSLVTNKSHLNLLLGRDIHTPFEVRAVGECPVSDQPLSALETLALERRPQIRQAKLKVRQAELDRRLTASQYSPDLDLAVTYLQPTNISLAPGGYLTLGAELKWRPVTWGKVCNEIQAKTQVVLQAKNSEKQISDQVLVEVGQQYRTVHADLGRVRAAKLGLEAARESLRVARLRYAQKAVLLQEVYDAMTRVASATRNYLDAVLALNIAQAELEQSIGADE